MMIYGADKSKFIMENFYYIKIKEKEYADTNRQKFRNFYKRLNIYI